MIALIATTAFAAPTTTPSDTQASPPSRRVLLLSSFGPQFAPYSVVSSEFRTELTRKLAAPIDFFDVSLETARFSDGEKDEPFINYLNALCSGTKIDLVMTLGGPAAHFAQRNRARLFPTTPILIGAVDERHLNSLTYTDRDVVVAVRHEPLRAVENILRVLPQTQNIAVVIGNSPLEQFWLKEVKQEFEPLKSRVKFFWLNELSFERIRKNLASLPPRSAIFYGVMQVDANGVLRQEDQVLADLYAVANAPIFGLHDYQLGRGIVGGPLMPIRELGRNSANVAARILAGEPPGNIKTPVRGPELLAYDWRELSRWQISENNLPPGSSILFRRPGFLQQHLWSILAATVLSIAASIAVILIRFNLRKRRQVEHALAESESRFRDMADSAPVPIWMSGPDKLCNFLNKAWFEFTGRSREQELGEGWANGIHPDDRDRRMSAYVDSFDRRREFKLEYRVLGAQGDYRWLIDCGQPRFASDGSFLGYIGSFVDITERKLAEEQFHQLVEAAPSAMIMVSPGGEIILVNAQTEVVFGYTRNELVGKSIEILVPEHLRSIHQQHRREYFKSPSPKTLGTDFDLFGRRKDGTPVPVEIGLNPVSTSQGTFVLASVSDISARRAAEVEARQHRNELAHLARVAMLGELSGSLAHELNQPLTAILSNAEAAQRFMEREPADLDEVRNILHDIVQDDNRAGEVIRRLRLLLKKGELQRNEIDVNETIREVLKLVNSDLLNHNVVVETDLQSGLPAIQADRVQVQQVLLNLIVNGCDAMAQTDLHSRRLLVRSAPANGDGIEISIADFGCGIPHDQVEMVFTPFFTTKAQGLGLGLSVCRTIVTAHGGKLWATNNHGAGASFHLTLPCETTESFT